MYGVFSGGTVRITTIESSDASGVLDLGRCWIAVFAELGSGVVLDELGSSVEVDWSSGSSSRTSAWGASCRRQGVAVVVDPDSPSPCLRRVSQHVGSFATSRLEIIFGLAFPAGRNVTVC